MSRGRGTQMRDRNGYASSVIMAKNSCSLISPSWSRSNSSIIACLKGDNEYEVYDGRTGTNVRILLHFRPVVWFHFGASRIFDEMTTHSSSSSNRSPISFATLRKFRKLIFPVLSSSKRWNARRISSIGSRASMRSLTDGM